MATDKTGFVYFVRCPSNGFIKIGRTGHPDFRYRFMGLAASSPVPLEFVGVLRAGKEFERSMHIAFAASWHHNEWFEPSPELIAFIEREVRPWDSGGLERELEAANARRKSQLMEDHGRLYGTVGCSFASACPECGLFLPAGIVGICYGSGRRMQDERRYAGSRSQAEP